ncbi:MAG: isoprenyl transferase [Planctomycetota bacterium]|nr:isoprenyl transferase [Planctomycetota bacterium]MDA1179920.1 isoprenyl transferase [Planctomycetota bacterium]
MPDPLETIPWQPPSVLPRHIAVIMDGNGRWAQKQDRPRIEGHRHGVASVRRTVEECVRLNIAQLTLYCLSSENWKRPQLELDFLMHLLEQYMIEERSLLMQQGVRVSVIGRRDGIPDSVMGEIETTIEMTSRNDRTRLCLAINYGGRSELVDAVRTIARQVRDNRLDPDSIDEQVIAQSLYTANMPDPDLLIRTAGEMRISNFLLWQISYAELWVTEKTWPEFEVSDLQAALVEYAKRERRFGGLSEGP